MSSPSNGDHDLAFLESDAHFSLTVRNEFTVRTRQKRKTLPGQTTHPKLFESGADKVSAQSHPEATPMSSTPQTAQEQRPANLAALRQRLQEMAASTISSAPSTKERPVVIQGPVIVIKGR